MSSLPNKYARPEFMHDSASDLFNSDVYINCLRTFYAYYGVVPSYKRISNIDHDKAIKWLETVSGEQIMLKHQKEYYEFDKRKMAYDNVLYLLNDEILVDIEDNGVVCVVYKIENERRAQQIIDHIKKYKYRPRIEPKISVITTTSRGLDLTDIKCPKPKMKLEKNYNDDLITLHPEIIKSLSQSDKSGLILLHGIPGSGKSTYIRFLVSSVKKQFIFLSPRLAGNLDAPDFINLLIENRNSVLVIEDAEELLTSREKSSNSAISILLNLTDGILGESLGIQTVCTFNTQLHNIDEALMRKGRLKAMYEFKELNTEKANELLKARGTNVTTSKPMTLADIYNTEMQDYSIAKNRKQIGFRTV